MPREHHLRVERTARYATVGEPGPDVRELWVACHGFGQLAARFVRPFEAIAAPQRLVVAPEALNRFYLESPASVADAALRRVGATWMTREDRDAEIADYVDYLDRLHAQVRATVPEASLTALGFSQGVATVCRWITFGRAAVSHLVLWSGPVPPELDLARFRERLGGASVTLVAASEDSLVPPAQVEAEAARLESAGIDTTVVRGSGRHALEAATLARIVAADRESGL